MASRHLALLVVAAGCSSRTEHPPPAREERPAVPQDARSPAFVRIPADQAEGMHYMKEPRGEVVGHMELVGEFVCRLATKFGPPDPNVALYADAPPQLGFPLKHVASGAIVVPFVGVDWGYAGGGVVGSDGTVVRDPEGELDPPRSTAAIAELDTLLSTTTPNDCAYTYPGGMRVDHAGVRDGKPFFEHVDLAETLTVRLAQLVYNDAHGGARKASVERQLCGLAQTNWSEQGADRAAPFPDRERLRDRLRRCLERDVVEIEEDVGKDALDADVAPEEIQAIRTAYGDLELHDQALSARIEQVRLAVSRLPRRR